MLWIARTGSHLPPTFGNWNTVFKRYRDWVQAGVFRRIFDAVSDDPDMEFTMVDATIVIVHRHAQESPATRSIAENHPVRPGGPLQNDTNMLKKSSKCAFFEAQRLQHEAFWQCLGQRSDRKLLLVAQDRACSAQIYRTRNEARADVFDIERFQTPPDVIRPSATSAQWGSSVTWD